MQNKIHWIMAFIGDCIYYKNNYQFQFYNWILYNFHFDYNPIMIIQLFVYFNMVSQLHDATVAQSKEVDANQ